MRKAKAVNTSLSTWAPLLNISPVESNNRCQVNVGFKKTSGLGMMVDNCNPSMWAGDTGGLCSLTYVDTVSNPKGW